MNLDEVAFTSVYSFLRSFTKTVGTNIALSELRGTDWKEITHNELRERSERLCRFFVARGIGAGDRVALLAESRIEYPEIAFSTFMSNAALVPIDFRLSAPEIARIIEHSDPKVVLVSRGLLPVWKECRALLTRPRAELALDDETGADLSERIQNIPGITIQEGKTDRPALIVYTSGTSGDPKGVQLPVSAILHEVRTLSMMFETPERVVALSMLPMNHLFEFTGLLSTLAGGGEIAVAKELEKLHLRKCFIDRQATRLSTVPVFLKTLKAGIESNVSASPIAKRIAFRVMMAIAALPVGQNVRRKLFASVHVAFGGRLSVIISGGAPLSSVLDRFFTRLGISVYEGYGLSETGPVVATNQPGFKRAGSVGRPIQGVEVKIDSETGEILTRGPHLMNGYYRNDALTTQAIDREGWFHTGDVGLVKSDGSLWITGRIKKMIVLEGGKKVHSEDVEAVIAEIPLVKDVCVLSSRSIGKPGPETVVAVVVPSVEMATAHGDDWPGLTAKLESAIRTACKSALADYKWPATLFVLKQDLPKTTTMKVKIEHVARLIRDL